MFFTFLDSFVNGIAKAFTDFCSILTSSRNIIYYFGYSLSFFILCILFSAGVIIFLGACIDLFSNIKKYLIGSKIWTWFQLKNIHL
jgi:hypothetical protein